MKELLNKQFQKDKFCFFCGEFPTAECRNNHYESVEEDMDVFAENWARGLLGDEEYERRMNEAKE